MCISVYLFLFYVYAAKPYAETPCLEAGSHVEAMRLCEKLEEMSVGFSSCLVWDQTCHEL